MLTLIMSFLMIDQKTRKPKKCCAMNWNKKKGCYLLSSYKKIENKKGWTAGYVADSPSCKAKFSKNKAFKYVKSALMSKKPTETQTVQDCLNACTGVSVTRMECKTTKIISPRNALL